jgi:hypothetical protein
LPVSFISLRFERVDNLGAYRIPPETGILIPSDYNNNQSRLPLTRGPAPVFRADTCFLLLAWPGRYGQTNWSQAVEDGS